jgi:poly(ADP-ribose) glycohydrolase
MKAYVGFRGVPDDTFFEESGKLKVITGKWGCGIFDGIPEVKLLIQWIAASLSGREIVFTTFQD